MKDLLSDEQKESILKALDEAIKDGPWDKSSFLRAIGKSLNEIRDNFASRVKVFSKDQIQAEANLANRLALRGSQQEVFISLYSADGVNIQSWEPIIMNLPRQMISRPIYTEEAHVQSLLKTKEHKLNEAYVVLYVNKADVIPLPPGKELIDKLGNPLLTLKDKTLDIDNITRFVHASGVYQFIHGRLMKE